MALSMNRVTEIASSKQGASDTFINVDKDTMLYYVSLVKTYDLSNSFEHTNDFTTFFSKNELLKKLIPLNMRMQAFYFAKLGFVVEGMPSKLLFMINELNKTLVCKNSPNRILLSLGVDVLTKFAKGGSTFLSPNYCIKDALDLILGYEVKLITDTRLCVVNANLCEVLVKTELNSDVIVWFDKCFMEERGNLDFLKSLCYREELGVYTMINNKATPLRTIGVTGGKIVVDDYDLRSV